MNKQVLEHSGAGALNHAGNPGGAAFVLIGPALLLVRFVAQEVAETSGTAHYFASGGHLELLRNRFAGLHHGGKGEKIDCIARFCKALFPAHCYLGIGPKANGTIGGNY